MIVREYINEKFTEELDPIRDMDIGIGHILPEVFKEILRKDYEKAFFTVWYVNYSNVNFVDIFLNQIHMNDLKELCYNDAIKKYAKDILEDYKIFTSINVKGKFEFYKPDSQQPNWVLLKQVPIISVKMIPDIRRNIKYREVKVQRDINDKSRNKLIVTIK